MFVFQQCCIWVWCGEDCCCFGWVVFVDYVDYYMVQLYFVIVDLWLCCFLEVMVVWVVGVVEGVYYLWCVGVVIVYLGVGIEFGLLLCGYWCGYQMFDWFGIDIFVLCVEQVVDQYVFVIGSDVCCGWLLFVDYFCEFVQVIGCVEFVYYFEILLFDVFEYGWLFVCFVGGGGGCFWCLGLVVVGQV